MTFILEFDDGYVGNSLVNILIYKISRLDNLMHGYLSFYKSNTGFYPVKFKELCQLVCPTVVSRSRHTNSTRVTAARRTKLRPQERLLASIMNLRGCNSIRKEAACGNYSRTSFREDAIFVYGVINEVLTSEIFLPDTI